MPQQSNKLSLHAVASVMISVTNGCWLHIHIDQTFPPHSLSLHAKVIFCPIIKEDTPDDSSGGKYAYLRHGADRLMMN